MDASLVQIETAQEDKFIYDTIVTPNWEPIWLGAANNEGTKIFQWLDGTGLTYSNWDQGYPWEYATVRNTIVMHHKNGKWYDWPADKSSSWYVCERLRNTESK